jgi:alpha-D-ribose 1-methylphosphonate 5-triphosphate diphosphatase PhnM
MYENDWLKDVMLRSAGTLALAAGAAVELPHAARMTAKAPVDAITVKDRIFRTLHSLLRLGGFTA